MLIRFLCWLFYVRPYPREEVQRLIEAAEAEIMMLRARLDKLQEKA